MFNLRGFLIDVLGEVGLRRSNSTRPKDQLGLRPKCSQKRLVQPLLSPDSGMERQEREIITPPTRVTEIRRLK